MASKNESEIRIGDIVIGRMQHDNRSLREALPVTLTDTWQLSPSLSQACPARLRLRKKEKTFGCVPNTKLERTLHRVWADSRVVGCISKSRHHVSQLLKSDSCTRGQ